MSRVRSWAIVLVAILAAQYLAFRMFHIPRQFEALLALTALLAYPVIRYPFFGVYAIFILGPFVPFFRRLYYLAYDRPGIDPLIASVDALIALTLVGLYFEFRQRRGSGIGSLFFTRIVLGYLIYLTLRVFVYNYLPLGEALSQFKNYGPAVLMFFIGQFFSRKGISLRGLWSLTIAIAVVVSLYGLKQLYIGFSQSERIWISSVPFVSLFVGKLVRPFSFFQAPVAFADYIQFGLIGALIVYGKELRRGFPIVLALSGLFLWATLITSVRSSWIGFAFTLPLWFLFVGLRGTRNRSLVLGGIVLALVAVELTSDQESRPIGTVARSTTRARAPSSPYFDVLVKNRSEALSDPFQEHSFKSRMVLWSQIFVLANEPFNALVGRGLGTLKADSLYITYLAEFGYPGMIFITFLIIAFTVKGLRIIDRDSDPNTVMMAKGITVMNIVLAIMSITGTHIHYFPGDVYFWFWNGVLVAMSRDVSSVSVDDLGDPTQPVQGRGA